MATPVKRGLSYGSSLLSRSESSDFGGDEDVQVVPDPAICENIENCDFWEKEENDIQDLHLPHDQGACFSEFINQLSSSLGIRLPSDSLQSASKVLQSSIQNFITCSILEIKKTIEDCYKVIENYEDLGITSGRVYLGNFLFTLNVVEKDLNSGSKLEIGKNIGRFYSSCKEVGKIPEFLIQVSKDLEEAMNKSYVDSTKYSEIKPISSTVYYKNFNYINDLENYQLRKSSLETFNMKKEIEWDRQEIKFMKSQLKSKIQDLKNREKDLKDESAKLRTERIKLAKENQNLEKELEDLDDRKNKYLKLQSSLKEILSGRPRPSELNLNSSFMSNSSVASIDQSENLDEEQKILEKELEDLKSGLADNESQDSISMKMNKIKNRLTTIKSEKMLNFSNRRSIKMNSVITKMQKSLAIKQNPLPRMPLSTTHKSIVPSVPFTQTLPGRRTTVTPIPFQVSTHHARTTTYTPPNPLTPTSENRSNNTTPVHERIELHNYKKSEGFFSSDFHHSLETEEKDECQEQKLRSLVLKEARLLQKEEEILKKENWIKSNIDKSLTDKEVLEVIRNERMGINRRMKEYEFKHKKLEEKFMEAERLEGKITTKSKDLEKIQSEIESDRGKLEQEREEWYQKLEDIQRIISESL